MRATLSSSVGRSRVKNGVIWAAMTRSLRFGSRLPPYQEPCHPAILAGCRRSCRPDRAAAQGAPGKKGRDAGPNLPPRTVFASGYGGAPSKKDTPISCVPGAKAELLWPRHTSPSPLGGGGRGEGATPVR